MKPSKKNILKWTQALRSGEFKQTRRVLQDRNGFCCLGVACKVFIPMSEQKLSLGFLFGELPSDQPGSPKWLKYMQHDFYGLTGDGIANLNDNCMTFDEIADLLEAVYVHEVLK